MMASYWDWILLSCNKDKPWSCFFLLSASWRTWFHSVAAFLKTKTCKIHIIICLCMGFITYPVLTFDQRVRKNKYIFFKKLSWVLGLEAAIVHFPLTCWKYMLLFGLENNVVVTKSYIYIYILYLKNLDTYCCNPFVAH